MDSPPSAAARIRDLAGEARERLRAERRAPSVQVGGRLDDDGYAALEACPSAHPAVGDMIRGTGGIRKIRWTMPGRGKRGGRRIMAGEEGARPPAHRGPEPDPERS